MTYWPFWAGGTALCAVLVLHYLVTRRMMAVSGRVTALIDRVRFGEDPEPALGRDELLEAVRAATAAEFGEGALEAPKESTSKVPLGRSTPIAHALFFGSLVVGGAVAALLAGDTSWSLSLDGELFASTWQHVPAALPLAFGGLLVGFGTRMAGGCTSGHGLCGVSRFQKGSLLATVAFFGTGVVASFALGWLLLEGV